MSRAAVKAVPKADLQTTLENLAALGPKLMSISAERTGDFIKQASDLIATTFPKVELKPRLKTCEIPETKCPPYCVCEITWEACRGETLRSTIGVTNRSGKTRNFTFVATKFQSAVGSPTTTLQLSPTSATLAPGERAIVTATLDLTEEFQSGQSYTSDVVIEGAYPQCVCITLKVKPPETCHCEIEQGDPPVRIRAHRWYHHFQCEEPCFPEGKPTPPKGPQ